MSTFIFHCPFCDQKFDSDTSFKGQTITCPSCKNEIIISEDIIYDDENNNSILYNNIESIKNTTESGNASNSEKFLLENQKKEEDHISHNAAKNTNDASFTHIESKGSTHTENKKRNSIYFWLFFIVCALGIATYCANQKYQEKIQKDKIVKIFDEYNAILTDLQDSFIEYHVQISKGINYIDFSKLCTKLSFNYNKLINELPTQFVNNRSLKEGLRETALAIDICETTEDIWRKKIYKSDYGYVKENKHRNIDRYYMLFPEEFFIQQKDYDKKFYSDAEEINISEDFSTADIYMQSSENHFKDFKKTYLK